VTLAYLSLGANLGEPVDSIDRAIRKLQAQPEITVTRQASMYRTAPVGPVAQDDFVNTVVEIETSLNPMDLLARCKALEVELGRVPGTHWGPRVIDIDLLMVGDLTIISGGLNLPHPEMWRRAFVLAPLAELLPDLHSPDGQSIISLRDYFAQDQHIALLDRG
jgi:2-amino-4-hydroxy-6-hydroxymethyldihydropteridine diphosphokinase